MKQYQAAVFDLDGTLLDTLDDLHAAVNHTMRYFGYPERTREEVRSFVGNGVDRLIELSVPGGAQDENFRAAITEYRNYYNAHSEVLTKPYDGIPALIERLQADKIPIAVASNKPHKATTDLCAKMFPTVSAVCGEQEKEGIRRKPHPDMVLHMTELLGYKPEECVYIGDSEVDLLTAKNAGMDCISVLWGFRDRQCLEEAGGTVFAETPEELYRMIRG
ncbi:MAG: HAD-IIIA family hydrolase [Clostridia bacterium]|nr:HAD-IIIA family hydrolase [Clostridia bacterium]